MMAMICEAGTALMISVGSRVGLFDAMDGQGPLTSSELAARAGLNERYVREWLAVMATGRIVTHDPTTDAYELPGFRADFLTTRAGITNLTRTANFVAVLGQVEDPIVDAFRNGGGLSYDYFPRFHELMAAQSSDVHDATLLDVTLPLAEGLVDRLSGGIDVADVGCGSGHAINLLARRFPRSRFLGIDRAVDVLDVAAAEARRLGLANAAFEAHDAANLPFTERFDLVTSFDAVHDQARPDLMLAGVFAALRSGGTYLCVDTGGHTSVDANMGHPLSAWLYTISCMHCMTVSLADGGMGLGTMWGEELTLSMLAEAGFVDVQVNQIKGDIVNNYYVALKA
jgi:SAM-dependent methyltransferase